MKKTKTANRPKFTNTRKVLRKQKRQEKKLHRQEHYLKKKNSDEKKVEQEKYIPGRFVKHPASDASPPEEIKKKKFIQSPQDILMKERQKEQKEVNRLNNAMEEQRRKIMVKANEDEDKVIKKLEKQLGLNKSKNKNNFFSDDGLDYLLEICDRATSEQIVAAEKHLADVDADSDFEDDLATVTGKDIKEKHNKEKDKQKQNKDKGNKNQDNKEEAKGKNIKRDRDSAKNSESFDSDNDLSMSDFDGSDGDDSDLDALDIDDETKDGNDEGSSDASDRENFDGSESEGEIKENTKPAKPDKKALKRKTPDKNKDSPKTKSEKPSLKPTKKERIITEEELTKVFSDDEVSHLSSDKYEFTGDDIGEDGGETAVEKSEKPDVWEDIYGRKRDKEGNVIKEEKGVYIPPHLRNKDSTSDKDLAQLTRQIKSILNKLAGSNLHWACSSIETLYSSNSRHSVNSVLSRLWVCACVCESSAPDRLVSEHAALVTLLHANVANEIGAHFLEELTKMFDALMAKPQPMENKTLDNVVACLAYLYNFKIYHASLLYDILSRLLLDLTEKNIECILIALRIVGGVLRKEEPAALKDFIHETQGRVAQINATASAGSRIKFLLEVLMAVKNNNLNKIPNYDPSYCEQLKKSIRTIIRKGNYVTPLNVRLEDLLKAEERGKWWIVGSAWEGARELPAIKETPQQGYNKELLELARKQRMNTDVRRMVFCVIMSAEDYMDAFEKLQHLGLKGHQEREIVHVLLACCLNETKYNPYYAILAQKLCDTHRKYQLSIQFSAWDKIKELATLPKHSVTNLAQLLVHVIMEKGLPLSILKIIEFSDLNKRTVRFMRQILLTIIMNADLQASLQVFHRISKAPKLHMFRESLRLFIQHFLIKNTGKKNEVLSEKEMDILRERALDVDKILTLHESKLKL